MRAGASENKNDRETVLLPADRDRETDGGTEKQKYNKIVYLT